MLCTACYCRTNQSIIFLASWKPVESSTSNRPHNRVHYKPESNWKNVVIALRPFWLFGATLVFILSLASLPSDQRSSRSRFIHRVTYVSVDQARALKTTSPLNTLLSTTFSTIGPFRKLWLFGVRLSAHNSWRSEIYKKRIKQRKNGRYQWVSDIKSK